MVHPASEQENQAYSLPFRSIGKDVMIWPLAKIISPERISIGNSVIIDDFVFMMPGQSLTLGNFIHIAACTLIAGGGELIMEDFTCLSGSVKLYTGTDDFSGKCLTNSAVPAPYRQPIRSFVHIKRHAIVGSNTVVLPGVTIGEGAAIGAGSVVLKDCEPWTIYAGSPAKQLKPRPKEKIEQLERDLRRVAFNDAGEYISENERAQTGS